MKQTPEMTEIPPKDEYRNINTHRNKNDPLVSEVVAKSLFILRIPVNYPPPVPNWFNTQSPEYRDALNYWFALCSRGFRRPSKKTLWQFIHSDMVFRKPGEYYPLSRYRSDYPVLVVVPGDGRRFIGRRRYDTVCVWRGRFRRRRH